MSEALNKFLAYQVKLGKITAEQAETIKQKPTTNERVDSLEENVSDIINGVTE